MGCPDPGTRRCGLARFVRLSGCSPCQPSELEGETSNGKGCTMNSRDHSCLYPVNVVCSFRERLLPLAASFSPWCCRKRASSQSLVRTQNLYGWRPEGKLALFSSLPRHPISHFQAHAHDEHRYGCRRTRRCRQNTFVYILAHRTATEAKKTWPASRRILMVRREPNRSSGPSHHEVESVFSDPLDVLTD